MKKIKSYYFFIFIILFLEISLHYFCFNNFNVLNKILFYIPTSLILGMCCHCFKKQIVNKIFFIIINVFFTIIFCSELIYFKIYESFFSLSSITMAGQLTNVSDQIFNVMFNNIIYILVLLIPLILAILFSKFCNFEKSKTRIQSLFFSLCLILHGLALMTVSFDKNRINSNYQIYNYISPTISSVEKFGLFTTIRLDIEKKILPTNNLIIFNPNSNPPQEKEPEIIYNELNINWDTIIENENNNKIKQIHEYFSLQESSNQNEYTRIFEGKNVIFILAESLYTEAISKELTPTLYKMQEEGFKFNNYYIPLYPTSTADGEYMTEWSLYPVIGNSYNLKNSAKNYNPFGFVEAFKNKNYYVSAYHGYTSSFYNRYNNFKNNGYDQYGFCDKGLNIRCEDLHASDLEMVKNSIGNYMEKDKFFTYYISISGHGNYQYNNNFIIRKNWDLVKNLDYSNAVKGYLAATIELDKALEYMTKELEKKDKLDDTVFVITSDHWPYYFKTELNNLEKLTGNRIYDKFELHKNSLIIYNNTLKEPVIIDKVSSNIDVLPTLLNLFGIDYDSRLLLGTDIFSEKESIIIFSNHSWITELGTYDGKKFLQKSMDTTITNDYIETINTIVNQKIQISSLIQKNNYYKLLFEKIKNLNKEDNTTPQ